MKPCLLLVFLILLSGSVYSQDIATIRQQQAALALAGNVQVVTRDDGLLSLSRLAGVPSGVAQVEVRNEGDLMNVINALYPYFGFSGAESLEYKDKFPMGTVTIYKFAEKINNLSTAYALRVVVGTNRGVNNRIIMLEGSLVIDREFAPTHILSEQQALASAERYLAQGGKRFTPNGNHSAQLHYQAWGDAGGLAPWWVVRMEGADSCFIAPNGEVDQISGILSEHQEGR